MAFPPDPIDAAVSGTIADPNEHPNHHNALAAAVNDITTYLETENFGVTPVSYWQFTGASGAYIEAPYDSSFNVANNLELVWRMQQADWTPSSTSMIASRRTSSLAWQLLLNTDGSFRFSLRTGSTDYYNNSIISPPAPLANGATYWFKLLRNSTTGKVELFIAPDSPTEPDIWPTYCINSGTQTAGVIDSASVPLQIGSERSGTSTSTAGLYSFSMRDHDRARLADWRAGQSIDVAGNVWSTTGSGSLQSRSEVEARDIGIPPLVNVWTLDLSDAGTWEADNGQEFDAEDEDAAFTSTRDGTGVAGVSPTIRVNFDSEELEGVDRRFWFPSMGVQSRDEVFLRYRVHVPSDDHWGGGGKMPGLAAKPADESVFNLAWGGSRPADSWSVRTAFDNTGRIGVYIYVDDPVSAGFPYGQAYISARAFDDDAWNEVVLRVDLARGEIQLWLNGAEALLISDVTFLESHRLPASVLVMNHGYGGTTGDGPNVAQIYHHAEYELWTRSAAFMPRPAA